MPTVSFLYRQVSGREKRGNPWIKIGKGKLGVVVNIPFSHVVLNGEGDLFKG